jgi:hypothetical protein
MANRLRCSTTLSHPAEGELSSDSLDPRKAFLRFSFHPKGRDGGMIGNLSGVGSFLCGWFLSNHALRPSQDFTERAASIWGPGSVFTALI